MHKHGQDGCVQSISVLTASHPVTLIFPFICGTPWESRTQATHPLLGPSRPQPRSELCPTPSNPPAADYSHNKMHSM